MTVDRGIRKQAKKNWKKHAKKAEENQPKRDRKKKSKVRRLCKGLCYGAPTVTEEDRVWRDGSDDDEVRREARCGGGAQSWLTSQLN